jgi:RNA polymerase sigma factor (sigma-70 family)
MSIRLSKATCEGISALFHWGAMGTWTDSQLVAQFVGRHEGSEPALRALIHRHGPMVLGVCQRVLGDAHAAEDAFQVTFLIFVKKADRLHDRAPLSNWLYGVACRVARKEKTRLARRRVVERKAADQKATAAWDGEAASQSELKAVIDQEIHQLPERYRLPILLCHLEGLRHDEVAQRLGCPVGTVESRLARGREQLRLRLARRGLAPSASVLLTAMESPIDPSALTALADATVATASQALKTRALSNGVLALLTSVTDRIFKGVNAALAKPAVLTVAFTGAVVAAGLGVYGAMGSPAQTPQPPEQAASSEVAIQSVARDEAAAPERAAEKILDRQASAEAVLATRAPSAVALPLEGITIDGRLDDWPSSWTRYPIRNQLHHPSYDSVPRDTLVDPSAYFMTGYDRQANLIYLAVVVKDQDVVVHPTNTYATDAVEIYIDGKFSEDALDLTEDDFWGRLDAATMPVLQYAAVPAKLTAYGDKEGANPSLVYGRISRTKTKMKYSRNGDTTTYEWAVQAFDQYPSRPTELKPGKRLGLEIAVLDKDPRPSKSAFFTWGSPPDFFKGGDAGSLGELILGEGP